VRRFTMRALAPASVPMTMCSGYAPVSSGSVILPMVAQVAALTPTRRQRWQPDHVMQQPPWK
jgi:hypothetical protein